MKNKKRIFTAFALISALSALAFTGCTGDKPEGDGNKTPAGVIEGDYNDKSDEEVKDIIDNINPDDLFGNADAEDGSFTLHVTENTEAGMALGAYMNVNGSMNVDYKMYVDADSKFTGAGTLGLKANYFNALTEDGQPQTMAFDVSASVYNDMQFVYGSFEGLDESALTGKLDINKLMGSIGGIQGGISLLDTSGITGSGEINIMDMLAMAKQFDVAVTFDTSDGVKVKLSASEETVWKLLIASEVEEETVNQIKELVTFNKFLFDVYLSIDANGRFDCASQVMDIGVSMPIPAPGSPAPTDSTSSVPTVTAFVKGSTVIKSINEKVTVPDSVKEYKDMTDELLDMIKSKFPQEPAPNPEETV